MRHRILITGCTGLVGHGICLTLLEKGYEVWGTSRRPIRSNHPAFHPVILDLDDIGSLLAIKPVLQNVDTIIHNAAILQVSSTKTIDPWEDFYTINFVATRYLLNYSIEHNVKQFIYISGSGLLDESFSVLDENTPYLSRNNYASSKIAAEIVCRQLDIQNKISTCIFRFPAPYGYLGLRNAVMPKFIDKVQAGLPITLWGNGERQQIFTFVEDIGQACHLAIEAMAQGIYHIAGPEVVSMKQLAESILFIYPNTGSKIIFEGTPDPQDGRKISISIDKAIRDLGYKPSFSLLQGLNKIAKADKSIFFFD